MSSYGETVIHHRLVEGEEDGYGQREISWVDETWDAAVGQGAAFAPGTSSEPQRGGSTRVTTSATLYDPLARSVDPRDQFTVRGRRYSVDADASGAWINPFTGWQPGGTITLKAVTGG